MTSGVVLGAKRLAFVGEMTKMKIEAKRFVGKRLG